MLSYHLTRKSQLIIISCAIYRDELWHIHNFLIFKLENYFQIRPPVTHVTELFYQKEKEESTPSDREIVKAVKTGLKLIKQAAKEGAKEGNNCCI